MKQQTYRVVIEGVPADWLGHLHEVVSESGARVAESTLDPESVPAAGAQKRKSTVGKRSYKRDPSREYEFVKRPGKDAGLMHEVTAGEPIGKKMARGDWTKLVAKCLVLKGYAPGTSSSTLTRLIRAGCLKEVVKS